MKKLLLYVLLLGGVIGAWLLYAENGKEIDKVDAEIQRLLDQDDRDADEALPGVRAHRQQLEGERTFNGILLAFVSAGVVGIFFVVSVLPSIAHRFTHAVYDSAEMVETDPMHDARSLVAQGDYDGAIEAFKEASKADPMNRLPWVEIAKIQKDNLEMPQAAIDTLRTALESQEWQVNDAAYFLFRLAELYDEELQNRDAAVQILQQVCDEFPETRHSANARHKLHEWGLV